MMITSESSSVPPPILKVEDLVVCFETESTAALSTKKLRAVEGISFELKKGSTLGIVGESGCGKSVTSLAIMALLPKPSGRIESGSILLYGDPSQNGTDDSTAKELVGLDGTEMRRVRGERISMVFQEPMTALNPVQKIKKQMQEVYTLHFPDMSTHQVIHEITEMLASVGIANPEKVIEGYPHELSGGMRQRVMIAMALAPKPDILIADEPTTALDVTVQAQILELIRNCQKSMGMSVILITHDLGVIAENCDEAVVMYGGKVVERASVKELFKRPYHPYTKGLLGSIPALAVSPKSHLPTIEGRVPSLEKMPAGCRFSTRCPNVMEICRKKSPTEKRIDQNESMNVENWRGMKSKSLHFTACHLYE